MNIHPPINVLATALYKKINPVTIIEIKAAASLIIEGG